jgi:hypothetical protein
MYPATTIDQLDDVLFRCFTTSTTAANEFVKINAAHENCHHF